MDDGKFEVLLIKSPKNIIELNKIIAALLKQNIKSEFIYYDKTANIEIQSEKKIAWTLDGEFGGKPKEVLIQNHEKTIEFLVPTKN